MHSNNSCSEKTTITTPCISDSVKIKLNPNGFSSLINIVYHNYGEITALDYDVADKTGKVCLHGYWPVNKGQNKTVINLSLLASGTYWLCIKDKNTNEVLVQQQVTKQ